MEDRSDTPFEVWAQSEGVPVVRGYYVANAYETLLKPWKRKGCLAAFIILEGGEGFTSAYVCEIPPGVSVKPEKHLFEERVYILQGNGETEFWNEGEEPQTIAWQEHSLFSPPLNVWHQDTNTGGRPAKYVAVTNAPLVFNIFRNPDFIFNTDFGFKDRYNGEAGYFDGVGKVTNIMDRYTWRTTWQGGGFIPDVRDLYLGSPVEYGAGFGDLQLRLSGNSTGAHLARIEEGWYKKPHRHAGGAHIIVVEGTGYALMWRDWDKRIRADFQKGTMYCPPEGWWHTHFNTGTQLVKLLALRCDIRGIGKIYRGRLGVKKGGDMLEHEDEDPAMRSLFEEELTRKGLKSRFPEALSL